MMRQRQQSWIDASTLVDEAAIAGWSRRRRLWNNAVAMFGPVL
jgi:cardiolipin synthase